MADKLAAYHAKRDFRVTPEPHGEVSQPGERLRFVIQKHHARRLHYDFRLEFDGTLKSWAVPKGPSLDPAEKRLAVHVEDHPLDYIDFHGDIPAHQYGAGHVEVWDTGYWEPQGDPAAAYRSGKLKFRLVGEKLHGAWTLVRTRLQASGGKEQWLLIKEQDGEARAQRDYDVTEALPGSVQPPATDGGDLHPSQLPQAAKKRLPDTLRPQLATLVEEAPNRGDWIFEVKFDGYRMLARVDGDEVKLFTRDGKDWTAKLPRQVQAIRALGLRSAWLDGEIVVLDKQGVPSFQLLQNAFDSKRTADIIFFAFDLPYCDGYDLRHTPLSARHALLAQLLSEDADQALRYSAPIAQPAQQLLESACRLSMEGIIGKRADSIYTGKRSADWVKLKCRRRQEFVVAGYTEPQGSRQFFGALLLAVYGDDGRLRYAGRVGTGFSAKLLSTIHRQLKALEQDKPPFDTVPAGVGRGAHWVKPRLVAEISFAEWTADQLLRQAVFHGLRTDKPALQVRRENAASLPLNARHEKMPASDLVQGVKITHPDRVIDAESGMRKLDLAHFYETVAPHILPFLKNRPVYLLRCPDGVEGEHFFQKHLGGIAVPGMRALPQELDPGHAPLMAIDDAHALVGAAQMGMIELHAGNATADRIEKPDCMVFDLDPDPSLPWKKVVEGALLVKVMLDELGLRSFVKTSGGKGLHLVVPLARRHGWDELTAFSQAVAQHLVRTLPKHFSAKMGEKNRIGKIFIDYLRNRRQASTALAFSVRARPGLPVSTPMAWEELPDIDGGAQWNIASLPRRLEGLRADPWQDYFSTRQTLSAAMKGRLGLKK